VKIGDMGDLLELMDVVKPIAELVIGALQELSPEIRKLLSGMMNVMCDLRIEAIKRYRDAGFSEDQAILLTIDQSQAIARLLAKKPQNG
jgi:hypothetical protein